MTARELLDRNGDFRHSPLIETARRLGARLQEADVPYCIVGGLALVHAGAPRTTGDVDILVSRSDWERLLNSGIVGFAVGRDNAVDQSNGIEVDVLFAGDDWGMVSPLPAPRDLQEWDAALDGFYAEWRRLAALKTAVYLSKKNEYGIEVAAKDLGDVVALLEANQPAAESLFEVEMHPRVRQELQRIVRNLLKAERKRRRR